MNAASAIVFVCLVYGRLEDTASAWRMKSKTAVSPARFALSKSILSAVNLGCCVRSLALYQGTTLVVPPAAK
jgi:hypothetical protein